MPTVFYRGPACPADPGLLGTLEDAELLRRFVAGDDRAFAVLVQRHSALVLGVCRRVLGHAQDAEDAFQAAFLILARKARSIRRQQSLAGWLYKVAYRTALRARANLALRKARERRACENRDALGTGEPACSDVGQVLDEEVRRLPEKYRTPVLLCYLQGQTNEEAARNLHCPTGTVKVRLWRARELLRRRLERRGLAISIGLLLASCLEQARAAVPEPLLATARGAGRADAGLASRPAVLAEQVLKGMALARIKVGITVLFTVLLLTIANGLTQQAHASTASLEKAFPAKPTLPRPPATDAPGPDNGGPPCLLVEQHPPEQGRSS
jgi:RNA polymerase sigma factor (sigma-70 family)